MARKSWKRSPRCKKKKIAQERAAYSIEEVELTDDNVGNWHEEYEEYAQIHGKNPTLYRIYEFDSTGEILARIETIDKGTAIAQVDQYKQLGLNMIQKPGSA